MPMQFWSYITRTGKSLALLSKALGFQHNVEMTQSSSVPINEKAPKIFFTS
jgi:hypothetical protein